MAFGYHCQGEDEIDRYARVYIQEQRHVLDMSMCLDINLSTFTGRSPSMSPRTVSSPLSLDIPLEIVLDDSIPLDDKFDGQGWNREGKLYFSSGSRAFRMTMRLHHEILELYFGPPPHNRPAIVQDLRQRLDTMLDHLPPVFRTPVDRSALDTLQPSAIAIICYTRLSILHAQFLLERAEKSHSNDTRFLEVAQKMLSLTITFFNMRDRVPGHTDGIIWQVSCTVYICVVVR